MTGYKRVNYYELCRLCTSSQQKDKIHIFREEGKKLQLQQKIQTCFPLLVCEHDYLPKVVCTSCIQSLEQCFMFRQNCINSESMLSSYFSNYRFTDDFKKAGKVYVKDTSPKTDQKIEEQIVAITEKKQEQVNPILVSNVVRESNQQQFFVELSPKPIPKQIKSNNNYSTINSNTTMNITKEKFNQTNQTIQNINFNTCVTRNLEQKVEMSNQTMMLIDMETLIDAGLPSDYKKVTKDKCHESQSEQKQETSWTVNGVRVYKCDVCEKIFKRREHLYQHSKLHSGVRPFCCIHCPKTFSRKEHLMRHLTSHSGVKDYVCDICSKRFSRPDNLKKHKKTHLKSPFRCDVCSKSFVVKHYYLAHMQAHQNGENLVGNIIKQNNNELLRCNLDVHSNE